MTTEQVYDVSQVWGRLLLKKIVLWIKTKTTTTTADRTATLKISGGLVKKP